MRSIISPHCQGEARRAKYLEELIMEAKPQMCLLIGHNSTINNLWNSRFSICLGKIAHNIKFPRRSTGPVEDTLRYHEAIDRYYKKEGQYGFGHPDSQDFVKDATNNVIGDPENNGETNKEFTHILIDLLPRTKSVDLEFSPPCQTREFYGNF